MRWQRCFRTSCTLNRESVTFTPSMCLARNSSNAPMTFAMHLANFIIFTPNACLLSRVVLFLFQLSKNNCIGLECICFVLYLPSFWHYRHFIYLIQSLNSLYIVNYDQKKVTAALVIKVMSFTSNKVVKALFRRKYNHCWTWLHRAPIVYVV